MIIIYHCFGGTHSSVVAAAIHLKMLPDNRLPRYKEIANLPYYDRRKSNEIGVPLFYGEDEFGNQVYIQGRGHAEQIIVNLLNSLLTVKGTKPVEVKLINTLKNINILTRVGGFLSRRLGVVIPGRILTVWGIQLNYARFLRAVKRVKAELSIA